MKNFAAKRKRDFLGRGSVQTVSQPNIKCSKVSFMFIYQNYEIVEQWSNVNMFYISKDLLKWVGFFEDVHKQFNWLDVKMLS